MNAFLLFGVKYEKKYNKDNFIRRNIDLSLILIIVHWKAIAIIQKSSTYHGRKILNCFL